MRKRWHYLRTFSLKIMEPNAVPHLSKGASKFNQHFRKHLQFGSHIKSKCQMPKKEDS